MKVKFLGLNFEEKDLKKAMQIAMEDIKMEDIKNDKGSNSLQKHRRVSGGKPKSK
jgi:hypothetical protein